MFRKPLTVRDKVKILRRLRDGKSAHAIAQELGVTRHTVAAVMRCAAVAWISGVEANERLRDLLDRQD